MASRDPSSLLLPALPSTALCPSGHRAAPEPGPENSLPGATARPVARGCPPRPAAYRRCLPQGYDHGFAGNLFGILHAKPVHQRPRPSRQKPDRQPGDITARAGSLFLDRQRVEHGIDLLAWYSRDFVQHGSACPNAFCKHRKAFTLASVMACFLASAAVSAAHVHLDAGDRVERVFEAAQRRVDAPYKPRRHDITAPGCTNRRQPDCSSSSLQAQSPPPVPRMRCKMALFGPLPMAYRGQSHASTSDFPCVHPVASTNKESLWKGVNRRAGIRAPCNTGRHR
jgi:hypothetical protein